jgi:hypothetical protein
VAVVAGDPPLVAIPIEWATRRRVAGVLTRERYRDPALWRRLAALAGLYRLGAFTAALILAPWPTCLGRSPIDPTTQVDNQATAGQAAEPLVPFRQQLLARDPQHWRHRPCNP